MVMLAGCGGACRLLERSRPIAALTGSLSVLADTVLRSQAIVAHAGSGSFCARGVHSVLWCWQGRESCGGGIASRSSGNSRSNK
eukprot:65091-Pyramimonas_sp.AAC.1